MELLDQAERLEFVSLQDAARQGARPDLAAVAAERPLEAALHVVLPDGRVVSGGSAVLEIVERLPGGVLFRPWRVLPGVPAAVDLAYRWVASHRALLARLVRLD